ncbi:uncharacterized protein E5676_scaffold303G00270 [Cucumis melo var. makuwa]|uniref:DUF4408 domain-containing protein n=2 Tax=Cucumis melo TaxID=3656 RepID=A0A5D3DZ88_CUCMM|nr:uncharacterized protein E6C27_scaffold243G00730 [Cucumis melo var. makuwa]TYK28824.1 uncharacterized protein E5676_scaffold303G00270 [Cucumis melo var. makuwa]
MESVNFYDIRTEKANAILKYRQFRKIANLFRFIELCLILIVISRFSSHLPTALKNFTEYFRYLSVTLISPRFVFLIGNAIVITLFAKSGQFSAKDPSKKNLVADLYEEFIKNSEKNNQKSPRTEINYQIKHIDESRGKASVSVEKVVNNPEETKRYQRCKSEKMEVVLREKVDRELLQRSETEKCKKMVELKEGRRNSSYPEDVMSNEEFRQTVEAFIARQQRLQREEEFSEF